MEPEGVPALLEALFIYRKAYILDKASKAALRLCNTHFKNLVDATVTDATQRSSNLSDDLNALINTEWYGLKKLHIQQSPRIDCPCPLVELPLALFFKFPLLERLALTDCLSLEALPAEIGALLAHLNSLDIRHCESFAALPTSLEQLTALKKLYLYDCPQLTSQGIAPLQHLTGLTSLTLKIFNGLDPMTTYPDFICNLTSLKELYLYSPFIPRLPDALGDLTNLEKLGIFLNRLIRLPESAGNLNALKVFDLSYCRGMPSLPVSFDDLMWRKAHAAEGSGNPMERIIFYGTRDLRFSSKMRQALEMLQQQEVEVRFRRYGRIMY